MKKKSIPIIIIVAVISSIMIVNSAWAGSIQSHRWEGVAIGLGAAIIGSAIIHQHKNSTSWKRDSHRVYVYEDRHHHHPKPPRHSGYWKIEKEWIPPTYKEVWNPGHYNRHGEWEKGQWIKIVNEPGYWSEKRVWIAGRVNRHRR
jgi:hypothetical protein